MRLEHATDRGWAWVILVAGMVSWTLMGVANTNGVFNVVFLEEFGKTKQMTSWLCSTQTAFWFLAAPLGTLLIKRYSVRFAAMAAGFLGSAGYFLTYFASSFLWTLFTFGVMTGTAFSISFICIQVNIGEYFTRYRNLAYGIANVSIGLGTFLCSIVINLSIETYGWKGSMLILSGVYLHTIVCGALYWPAPRMSSTKFEGRKEGHIDVLNANNDDGDMENPSEKCFVEIVNTQSVDTRAHHKTDNTIRNAFLQYKRSLAELCNVRFTAVCLCTLFVSSAMFLCYIHFPAYFILEGATSSELSTIYGIMGLCNIACRLLGGVATNHPDMDVVLFHISSSGITSIIVFCCPLFASSRHGRLAFAALFGFYGNWNYSLLSTLLIKLFGLDKLAETTGIVMFVCGLGTITGPPFAGWLFDVTGTYNYSFYLAGVLYLLGAVSILFTQCGVK